MESAIESPASSATVARKPRVRLRLPVIIALVLIAFSVRYALSPKGPSAYERWFATLEHTEIQPSAELGDVPQAEPQPQEEIEIYAIGKVRGESIRWQLHYSPDSKDERALRILELAREADAFPSSQQLSPEELAIERVNVGAQDSITLIVSTKSGGFRGEFGPAELGKNVKLATMLRLFETFSLQDSPKERY